MSIIFVLTLIGSISHVDFKKWPCRPVDFKSQGPWANSTNLATGPLVRFTHTARAWLGTCALDVATVYGAIWKFPTSCASL